jgi:hypothetical protein
MTQTHIKVIVTMVTVIFLILHLHQLIKFDMTALSLLLVAILPWLSSFLQSAELPGGWKFQFNQVKEEQQKQRDDIKYLKFLIEGFVSEDEWKHLKKLNSNEPFQIKLDDTTKYFEEELRRLRSLGLVANPPEKGIRSLLINDGQIRNVKEHFYITEKGKEYLKFREST